MSSGIRRESSLSDIRSRLHQIKERNSGVVRAYENKENTENLSSTTPHDAVSATTNSDFVQDILAKRAQRRADGQIKTPSGKPSDYLQHPSTMAGVAASPARLPPQASLDSSTPSSTSTSAFASRLPRPAAKLSSYRSSSPGYTLSASNNSSTGTTTVSQTGQQIINPKPRSSSANCNKPQTSVKRRASSFQNENRESTHKGEHHDRLTDSPLSEINEDDALDSNLIEDFGSKFKQVTFTSKLDPTYSTNSGKDDVDDRLSIESTRRSVDQCSHNNTDLKSYAFRTGLKLKSAEARLDALLKENRELKLFQQAEMDNASVLTADTTRDSLLVEPSVKTFDNQEEIEKKFADQHDKQMEIEKKLADQQEFFISRESDWKRRENELQDKLSAKQSKIELFKIQVKAFEDKQEQLRLFNEQHLLSERKLQQALDDANEERDSYASQLEELQKRLEYQSVFEEKRKRQLEEEIADLKETSAQQVEYWTSKLEEKEENFRKETQSKIEEAKAYFERSKLTELAVLQKEIKKLQDEASNQEKSSQHKAETTQRQHNELVQSLHARLEETEINVTESEKLALVKSMEVDQLKDQAKKTSLKHQEEVTKIRRKVEELESCNKKLEDNLVNEQKKRESLHEALNHAEQEWESNRSEIDALQIEMEEMREKLAVTENDRDMLQQRYGSISLKLSESESSLRRMRESLDEQVYQLSKDLKTTNDAHEELIKKNQSLEATFTKNQELNRKISNDLLRLEQEKQDLLLQHAREKKATQEAIDKLEAENKNILEAKYANQKIKEVCLELEKENESLVSQLVQGKKDAENALMAFKSENLRLQKALRETQEFYENIKQELQASELENEALELQLSRANQDALDVQIALKSENQKLQKSLMEAQESHERIKRDLVAAEQENDELVKVVGQIEQQNASIDEIIAENEATIRSLKKDVAGLLEQLELLAEEKSSVELELYEVKQAFQEEQEGFLAFQGRIQKKFDELSQIHEEKELEYQKGADTQSTQLQEIKDKYQRLREELNEATAAKAALERDLSMCHETLAEWEAICDEKLKRAQDEVSQLSQQNDELSSQFQEIQEENELLKAEQNLVVGEDSENSKLIEVTKEQLLELQKENESLREDLENVKQRLLKAEICSHIENAELTTPSQSILRKKVAFDFDQKSYPDHKESPKASSPKQRSEKKIDFSNNVSQTKKEKLMSPLQRIFGISDDDDSIVGAPKTNLRHELEMDALQSYMASRRHQLNS